MAKTKSHLWLTLRSIVKRQNCSLKQSNCRSASLLAIKRKSSKALNSTKQGAVALGKCRWSLITPTFTLDNTVSTSRSAWLPYLVWFDLQNCFELYYTIQHNNMLGVTTYWAACVSYGGLIRACSNWKSKWNINPILFKKVQCKIISMECKWKTAERIIKATNNWMFSYTILRIRRPY